MSVRAKVLIVGDSGVGKTSLILKYIDAAYQVSPGKSAETLTGSECMHIKHLTLDGGNSVTLGIHDTAGEERFRSITSSAYKGADAVIVAFDVTDNDTYANLSGWLGDVNRYSPASALKMVVATKTDLVTDARAVSQESIDEFVTANECVFFDTSALTGVGVGAPFELVAVHALQRRRDTSAANSPTIERRQRGVAYKKEQTGGGKCVLL